MYVYIYIYIFATKIAIYPSNVAAHMLGNCYHVVTVT